MDVQHREIDVERLYENDTRLKREDVKSLQEWSDMQPHLPKITELQAALFLHSCYYSNEQAKNTLDIYFTVKTLCNDIFGNRSPSDPAVQQTMNSILITPLPKRTPDGCLIIFIKFLNSDPDHFNFPVYIRCFDMITTLCLHLHGPPEGLILLVDMDGILFGHFLKLSVITMKKLMYYLQEALPSRLKSIQFFNMVPFMDKFLALMKPFMKKELFDALVMHDNIESVHKNTSREILPENYGGNCDSIDILHEKYKALMYDNVDFFKFQESQKVDESQRPGKPKSINEVFGVEGTFKKLAVD